MIDENFSFEDLETATRASARMRRVIEREILAGTFTPQRQAQLYEELRVMMEPLRLPSYYVRTVTNRHHFTSSLFDIHVMGVLATLKKRGILTVEDFDEAASVAVGGIY